MNNYLSSETLKQDKTLIQLTISDMANAIFTSGQYGQLTWESYLKKEVERIRSRNSSRFAAIAIHPNKKISLWVNDMGK